MKEQRVQSTEYRVESREYRVQSKEQRGKEQSSERELVRQCEQLALQNVTWKELQHKLDKGPIANV